MHPSLGQSRDVIIQFFHTNDCVLKQKDDRPKTHLSMDGRGGGKFHVPFELMNDFYAAYGEELAKGRRLSYVEVNTAVYKLHFDVDFPEQVSDERLCEFCRVLCEAVAEYYPQESLEAIACVTFDSSMQRTGRGLHVVFPGVLVTSEISLKIWPGVVSRCEERLDWCTDLWETILDFSVLRENGSLRMVGSDKCQKCSNCQDVALMRKSCDVCQASGKVYLDKVYWPWKVFPETELSEKTMHYLENRAHAAKRCSIRSSAEKPSPGFVLPAGAPLEAAWQKGARALKRDFGKGRLPSSGKQERLQLTREQEQVLTNSIREYDENFQSLSLLDVTRRRVDREIWDVCYVRVKGFNDRFCLNKGATHTSSQIYFEVSHKGLCQACFCQKSDARKSGECCRKYRGLPKPLPPEFISMLLKREPSSQQQETPFTESLAHAQKKRKLEKLEALVTFGNFFLITPDAF